MFSPVCNHCIVLLQGFRGFPGRIGNPGLDGDQVFMSTFLMKNWIKETTKNIFDCKTQGDSGDPGRPGIPGLNGIPGRKVSHYTNRYHHHVKLSIETERI